MVVARSFLGDDDETSLPPWAEEVAASVDLDTLCEEVVNRDIMVAFPELAGDTAFAGYLRASVRENLLVLQGVLSGRLALEQVRLGQPLMFGRVQAELSIPQSALHRSYRVGFFTMWRAWSASVRAEAQARDIPREETTEALSRLTAVIWGYQDEVASQVADQYARADDALRHSRSHVRQRLVQELLRGNHASLPPSDLVTLDYDVSLQHVVVVLPELSNGVTTQFVVGLREAAGLRQSLVHPLGHRATAVWLGAGTWKDGVRRLRAALHNANVMASMSEPHLGLLGFRHALEQAQEVERIRGAWGAPQAPRVLEYTDVALEILLLADPERARSFVEEELGALSEETVDAARLRETLHVSFALGSHVATARHLELHEHTVRNRLHKAEQQLGHRLTERRTELQVALRLYPLVRNPS